MNAFEQARAPNGEESNWRIELILDHAHPQCGFQEPEHPISAVAGVPCGFEAWSEILGSLEGRGTFSGGNWVNVQDRYLGLKFQIKGKTHFGWARLNVAVHGTSVIGTLTGYAYETIAGKAIIAGATSGPDDAEPAASLNKPTPNMPTPEPPTLGALAMGAPGLSIWRRKETVGAIASSS